MSGLDCADLKGPNAYGALVAASRAPGEACELALPRVLGRSGALPVPLAAEVAARDLKEAARAVVRDRLLGDASWAANLLTIFAE